MSHKQLLKKSNKSGVHAYSCRHYDPFRHLQDDELADFISGELHERKTEAIRKTVQMLGRQKTIQIFHETVNELKSGGAHTWNGSRHRSPGGVFFTIIKENPDPDIAKEYHTIKQDDVEEQERQWMKRKRQRDRKAHGQGNNNSGAGTRPGEPVPPRETTSTCSNEPQHASIPPQVSASTQLQKRPVTVQRKDSTSSERLDEPVVFSTKGRD
ncbi:phosphorylated adapter RNA export protein-like isoform X2 [Littorina saxatilis]|uniref:Phosphorylated adapter RNA export protein n=1 Tax=Littorina saxatilis TaxID=31220 RepID=A0AAN9GQV6_9CAEN